jgi:hypothetical protein
MTSFAMCCDALLMLSFLVACYQQICHCDRPLDDNLEELEALVTKDD